MEKNEVMSLLIFAVVAVVGAVLLLTSGLNMSDENTGLAAQRYITTPVKEQVKCVFEGSTKIQFCSSNKGSCKGVATCIVTVAGKKGEKVAWKSSCGGYAYSTIDGQNEYANFRCVRVN